MACFIPLIIDTRDCPETELEIFTCGVFTQKSNAVNTLLNVLLDKAYIRYDKYLSWRQIKRVEEITDEKTFRLYLARKVDGNFDNLKNVCEQFGEYWYQNDFGGWNIRLDEHIL